jgi:hypothetical protein
LFLSNKKRIIANSFPTLWLVGKNSISNFLHSKI